MSSRLYLGKQPLDFHRHFLWVLLSFNLAILGFGSAGFGSILRSDILRSDYKNRDFMFVAVASHAAHSIPTCCSLRQLHGVKWGNSSKRSYYVLCLSLVTCYAFVFVLLVSDVTAFLLVGNHNNLYWTLLTCLGVNHCLLHLKFSLGSPDDL